MAIESLQCPHCDKVHNIEIEENSIAIVICDVCNKEFNIHPTEITKKRKWLFFTKLIKQRRVSKMNV